MDIEIPMKTRQLTSKWTVTLEQDDNPQLGESAINDSAKILQEEIDWGVICDLLVELGWTQVTISEKTLRLFDHKPNMVADWVKQNILGGSRGRGTTWLFERAEDASMFILRWS